MKKILVVRNDKIGDFMLAWPSFAMLKLSMPDTHVTALVPSYTKALAEACPWIDEVILDPGKKAEKGIIRTLIEKLKSASFDASINLFSDSYNAKLVWKAGIPNRVAPATKLAQIFYNHRVKQKRSQSAKPEFEYNLDLIRAFLQQQQCSIVEPQAPYFNFPDSALTSQRQKLAEALHVDVHKPWVYVHAGSGGSANNLSLTQYAELIAGLAKSYHCEFILTAGPGEEEKARELQDLLSRDGIASALYAKNDGLIDFSCSIACAQLFIAGSTGPLHIAAAIDVPTIGFFPAKRSATPLRWKPINSDGKHLPFCPPQAADKATQENMSRINMSEVLKTVTPWVKTFLS